MIRSHILNSAVVMFSVVPVEISFKIVNGLFPVPEPAWIGRSSFDCIESRFYERIVIGGTWTAEQLRHVVRPTNPVKISGTFVFGTYEGALFVFGADDGKKLWKYNQSGDLKNGIGEYLGNVYALTSRGASILNGYLIWARRR